LATPNPGTLPSLGNGLWEVEGSLVSTKPAAEGVPTAYWLEGISRSEAQVFSALGCRGLLQAAAGMTLAFLHRTAVRNRAYEQIRAGAPTPTGCQTLLLSPLTAMLSAEVRATLPWRPEAGNHQRGPLGAVRLPCTCCSEGLGESTRLLALQVTPHTSWQPPSLGQSQRDLTGPPAGTGGLT
jgi:hypothetical protein